MRLLERLRGRPTRQGAAASGPAEASSADGQRLPIARYDELNRKQLIPQLSRLSQLELAAVEAHERSHQDRRAVLDRVRWLRGSEPLSGYDTLESDAIIAALADADAATVKAVRSYERHHRGRSEVLAEAARVLPTARASAQQNRARKENAALVQSGIRSHPHATKSRPRPGSLDRVDAARDQRNEREQLREEARYRRERLDLYRARLYGGRAASHGKLRELQRAADGAAARLRRAEAAAPPTQPPT